MTDELALFEAAPPQSFGPFELVIAAACLFEPKPCKTCGRPKSNREHRQKNVDEGLPFHPFGRQNGCASCGKAKGHDDHFGSPPSLNIFSGRDPSTYRSMIETWKSVVLDRLRVALPEATVFEHVLVEGLATFPKTASRDQGNHRVLIEKAVGDALVEGGWLVADTWDRYEFGGLEQRVEPGVSSTRLVLFARA